MRSFKSSTIVKSAKFPGNEYRIRTLNVVQRSIRDAGVAEHRMEHQRLTNERFQLFKATVGATETEFVRALKAEIAKLDLPADHAVSTGLSGFLSSAEMEAKLALLPAETVQRISLLNDQATAIHNQFIAPSIIKAAFLGGTGFDIDGEEPTADNVIAGAKDDLLNEIYDACERAGELTDEEAKN